MQLPSNSTPPLNVYETAVPSYKMEGETLETYIKNLQIGSQPACAKSKPVSRGAADAGPWGRRGTIPYKSTRRMGFTSHSQRPRLRYIGSPDPESEIMQRHTGVLSTEQDLGEAILCKTIPTMVKEY